MPPVFLISGPVNSGKTARAEAIVAALRREGVPVGGVLSHGIWEYGTKVGYFLEDLRNGATHMLASVHLRGGIRQGRFLFTEEGIQHGRNALASALGYPVVIVDEVGPLELQDNGFARSLVTLLQCKSSAVVLVVRSGLEDAVIKSFDVGTPTKVGDPPDAIRHAVDAILAAVNITGVILAGGKSRRMGYDKALVDLHGIPLIQHVADNLSQLFTHRMIVSDHGDVYAFLGLPVIHDVLKDRGPLGGIHAALLHAPTQACFIASCDVPFASPALMRYLIAEHQGAPLTVPSLHGQLHPLCGIHSKALLPLIEQQLQSGHFRVQDLIPIADARIVPISEECSFFTPSLLKNINSRQELEECGD